MECININFTIYSHIASNPPLDGFDTHFSSAIAVREGHRAKVVVDPPIVQKLPGGVGDKFRATIGRELVWYTVGGKVCLVCLRTVTSP